MNALRFFAMKRLIDRFVVLRRLRPVLQFALILVAATLSLSACATYGDERLLPGEHGKIETLRRGTGTPTIVLLHGLGDDMKTWAQVMKPLSKVSSVLAYNRPGYGRSETTSAPRDAVTITNELRALLDGTRIDTPVILVGHSLGGVFAEVFARRFPERVAGVVLIDPAVPGQTALIRKLIPVQYAMLPALMLQEPITVHREFRKAERSENQILAFPPYRAGPEIILAASNGDLMASASYVKARQDAMQKLANASGAEVRSVASGHFIQKEKPGAVTDAVIAVLSRLR